VTRTFRYHVDAQAEQDDAVLRYEETEAELGLRFADAVDRAVDLAVEYPEAAPRASVVPEGVNVRQRVIANFPFLLIYTIEPGGIRIEAVAHTSREPGYWRSRLKDR
jgi:toxin ParE1/3/4